MHCGTVGYSNVCKWSVWRARVPFRSAPRCSRGTWAGRGHTSRAFLKLGNNDSQVQADQKIARCLLLSLRRVQRQPRGWPVPHCFTTPRESSVPPFHLPIPLQASIPPCPGPLGPLCPVPTPGPRWQGWGRGGSPSLVPPTPSSAELTALSPRQPPWLPELKIIVSLSS